MYEVLILAGVVGAMGATGFVLVKFRRGDMRDWRRDKKAEPEPEPEHEKIHQVNMGPYRSMGELIAEKDIKFEDALDEKWLALPNERAEPELHGLPASEALKLVKVLEAERQKNLPKVKAELWEKHVAKPLDDAIKQRRLEMTIYSLSSDDRATIKQHARDLGYKAKDCEYSSDSLELSWGGDE